MIARSQLIADDRRRSQMIAEVCFHMIAELFAICDPRSAIVCDHMETGLYERRECAASLNVQEYEGEKSIDVEENLQPKHCPNQ